MSAALKHNLRSENLSRKPPLGENRAMLRLVWENPQLSDYQHREKSQVQLRLVSGQTLYTYVLNNPLRYIDPFGLATCGHYPEGHPLRWICENSPGDEGKLECVRKCLRDTLPPNDNTPDICEEPGWYFEDHPVCWWECDYIPWPY